MSNEKSGSKYKEFAKGVDIFMLVGNVYFFAFAVYAYSNGVTDFFESRLGMFYFAIIFISATRLILIKRVKMQATCKAVVTIATGVIYVVSFLVLIVSIFLLFIGLFHDKKLDDPKRYNRDMFYGGVRQIVPEKIPTAAKNIEFYYKIVNFSEYDEAFLQYSLPPQEYAGFKEKILLENSNILESEFFENSYDIDVGLNDKDDISHYIYDFVSFCDEEYVVRFICAKSQVSIEPYFKTKGEVD